jgi:hypothetical protein
MYFVGPVLLGVLHLAADVRYLVFRRTLPRAFLVASVVLAIAVTGGRLCTGFGVANATLGARVDIGLGLSWVALGLAFRLRDSAGTLSFAWLALAIVGLVLLAHPARTELLLTHVHNLMAFVLWLTLFRRRAGWTVVPVVVVIAATAVLLSGAYLPWTASHGGLLAFGQRASRLASGIAPGVSLHLATSLAVTFVFLQSVHYAVWTGWIAQDCLPGEGTPTFRMTLRSLTKDFRPLGLAAIALVTLGFAVAACFALRQSVAWYMTVARAHVWFELAAFACLVGRPAIDPRRIPVATPSRGIPSLVAA